LLTKYFPYCVHADSLSNICAGGVTGYWTSGQRRNSQCNDDPFVWKNYPGTEVALTYTNWASGEPNCQHGNENCIQLTTTGSHDERWNDERCEDTLCAMCEMDLGDYTRHHWNNRQQLKQSWTLWLTLV